jgi:hypothetical protein
MRPIIIKSLVVTEHKRYINCVTIVHVKFFFVCAQQEGTYESVGLATLILNLGFIKRKHNKQNHNSFSTVSYVIISVHASALQGHHQVFVYVNTM